MHGGVGAWVRGCVVAWVSERVGGRAHACVEAWVDEVWVVEWKGRRARGSVLARVRAPAGERGHTE